MATTQRKSVERASVERRQVVQKSKIYTLQMPFSEVFEDLMGR